MNETKLTIDKAVSFDFLTKVSGINTDLSCAVDNMFAVIAAITEGVFTSERANGALTGAVLGLMHVSEELEKLLENTKSFPVTREVTE